MRENEEKQIQDWQEKLRHDFGDSKRLYQYLFETLDNFLYRYLETTTDKNLKTTELGPGVWGAKSFETDMMTALKVQHPGTKEVVMEYAKAVPKAQGPKVGYALYARVKELAPERGHLVLTAEVQGLKKLTKEVDFKYDDLAVFRKQLALKLEEACVLFL